MESGALNMETVRNVYCIGRNYRLHAEELGNAVPDEPMVFMKPTHALVPADGRSVPLPSGLGEIHYEAELVIRIARPYVPGASVDDLVDGMALGVDFTLRDVQSELKRKGHPWLKAKGFLHSAPITPFVPFPGMKEVPDIVFSLCINGAERQRGKAAEMIFGLQEIVDYCGRNYGLDQGDLMFTGAPAGVGAVSDEDRFALYLHDRELGTFTVSLRP